MGFSLKMFIKELKDIFNDPFLSDFDKARMAAAIVEDAQQYAKDCGVLV